MKSSIKLTNFCFKNKKLIHVKKCLRFNIILKLKVNPGRTHCDKIKKAVLTAASYLKVSTLTRSQKQKH